MDDQCAANPCDAVDEAYVEALACKLEDHEIPAVLWGNFLLTIYGVPSIVTVSLSSEPLCFETS